MNEKTTDNTGQWAALAAADFEMLLESSRALASELRLGELLAKVMDLAARVVRAESGSILLLDEGAEELYFHVTTGEAAPRLRGARLKVGEGLAGWVAQNRQPLIVNDVRRDPRWSNRVDKSTDHVTRQVVAVPLLHQGRCLGVVEGINKRGDGGFSATDRRALEIFAAQVAVSVENARLFERLRDEKENLSAVFREMSDGAVLLDGGDRVLFINEAAARVLGWPGEGAVGRPFGEVARDFETRSEADGFEWTRKSGKSLILGGVRRDLQGGRGTLLVFRDVTEEKREERMKRNFLSLVSHKLRTPLAVITGYAPLLMKDPSLGPLPQKGLAAIDAQGRRLAALVDKLLRFTALEAEDLNLTREALIPRLEIDGVLESVGGLLAESGARVQVDPEVNDLPAVRADAERFRDVFRQLVENAVKFNPKAEKIVRLSGGMEGDRVRLCVEDNGPGVPPEEIPNLFQKFHQIEDHFTGQVEGAGLGLALAKRLVEAHGGDLTAGASALGGVAFATRWPAA